MNFNNIAARGKQKEALDGVLHKIKHDPEINAAILKAVREGDLEAPEGLKLSMRLYREATLVEKGVSLAFKYALNDLIPFIGTVVMNLNHDKIIDTIIPDKRVASHVKGVLSLFTGKKSQVTLNPSKNEAASAAKE